MKYALVSISGWYLWKIYMVLTIVLNTTNTATLNWMVASFIIPTPMFIGVALWINQKYEKEDIERTLAWFYLGMVWVVAEIVFALWSFPEFSKYI